LYVFIGIITRFVLFTQNVPNNAMRYKFLVFVCMEISGGWYNYVNEDVDSGRLTGN